MHHSSFLLYFTLLTSVASAQVLQPASITVTSTFTNPAGAVKSRLESTAGPGILAASVGGNTTEASPRTATANMASSLTDTSATVPLTVDAAGSPQWRVGSTLRLSGYGEDFYFGPSAPIATVPGGSYPHTFSSVVSIVDMTFSAAVSGGTMIVTTTDGTRTLAQLSLPAGNRAEVVVPGGVPLVIQLAVETGSGGTAGSLRRVVRTLNTWSGAGGVPANTIQPVNLNISEAATLGALTGTFDVAGEAELAGATTVRATYFSHNFPSYGTWIRSFDVPGDPASGTFTLGNLPSSDSIAINDPGVGSNYGVQGTTYLKNQLPSGNRAMQYIRSKMLTSPAVPGGGTASMGTTFAMTPGSIHGTIQLHGPAPEPGTTPVLHRISTAADNDANADGVPDGGGDPNSWLNASTVNSRTAVDQSSYGGAAHMVMERTVAGATLSCEYELICPSPLSGLAVTWTAPSVGLAVVNDINTEAAYFNTRYEMRRAVAAPISLVPGASEADSYSVEMGEVTLVVRSASPAVNIWQPQLQWHPLPGGLAGDPGNAMLVEGISAYGWPTSAAAAAQRGSIRTVLPAGTYTVRPTVNTVAAGGVAGQTTLAPFTINVPPRGRVTADNGLVLNASIPACVGGAGSLIYAQYGGGVASTVQYSVDGGPLQNATHFMDAVYSFNLPGGLPAGVHTVTVIVTTVDGRTASQTHQFEVDLTPPVITCPPNMDIYADFLTPQEVNYPAPTATDNCGGPVTFICNPPSGAVFPGGTTFVDCTATDAAGNSASCLFTITVHPPCPPPMRSHFYNPAQQTYFRIFNSNDIAGHSAAAMTAEAWVKREDDTRCETIIAQNYAESFWFGFCGNALRFYRSGGSYADSTVNVPDGAWTHVAASYDGTTVRFYINGQLINSAALSNTGPGNSDPITLGGDFTEGSYQYGFHGHLDEVRLWSRALGALEVQELMNQQFRGSLDFAAFGSGGPRDEISGYAAGGVSTPAPEPRVEGILPKWLIVPRTPGTVVLDGEVDPGGEYLHSDIMVIRYRAGAAGIRDALAYFTWRNETEDRALYIGVKGVRDVVAPWTRAQSFLSVYADPQRGTLPGALAGPGQFRFNSRALDGSFSPLIPAAGNFQRGNGAGNYADLTGTDPLNFVPAPIGLIGAGGDSVEFRFDLSAFGGDPSRDLRMALAHHWIGAIGDDAAGPAGMGWVEPSTWAPVMFSGVVPELHHCLTGDLLRLDWQDAGCGFILELSFTLAPDSWMPLTTPGIRFFPDTPRYGFETNIAGTPRAFFRLRRP